MNKTVDLFSKIAKILAPPPKLKVSDWADSYRRLSSESSAEPGKWNTSRAEYQREIMNALNEPETERIVLMTSAQVGKALDVDTPILTTKGWSTMGDLKKGDYVFAPNGKPVEVLFATEFRYDRECYKVEFSDGSVIVADKEHKWKVKEQERKYPKVLTTGEMLGKVKIIDHKGKTINRYSVPATKAIEFHVKDLEGCRVTETEERRIVNIEPVETRPVKCISVDSEDHLYLAGLSLIPTHNTELILNAIGYYIDYDPSPIMVVQPTLDMAKTFSKDRLAPMIRDTPAITSKVGDDKKRDGDNTVLHKKFVGGHVTLVGANSPSSLASRPIRVLLADEVDRFPASAGVEGDPLNLAIKRTTTFWNRKMMFVSTPTIKDFSRIEREYENSTKEEWNVRCPGCGKLQPFKWESIKFEDVTMECKFCKEHFDEFSWKEQEGRWVARAENEGIRGFHLNELASPWKRWADIIKEFKEAKKNPETLKVWINTTLGETWEDASDIDFNKLIKRRERYIGDIPEKVLLLTAGVDTQDDRLEVEVVGWGHDKESWGVEYKVFYGDPGQEPVWIQLDDYLQKEFKYPNGSGLHIATACIDSGGHYTSEVYKFCKARQHRRIYAIKGRGGAGLPFIGAVSRNNRENTPLFNIGVDQGKQNIVSSLNIEFEGPGYCHFPIDAEKGYDQLYFEGLTSETKKTKWYKGQPKVAWVKKEGVRNEPFDCRNYAMAAMEIFEPNFDFLEKNIHAYNMLQQKPIKRRGIISKGL